MSQAGSSTAQTPKGRVCKLDLPVRSAGLCTDSLENLENDLEGSKGPIVHVPSVEYGSRIPETTSEFVRNPHTYLVEVQNCGQRGREPLRWVGNMQAPVQCLNPHESD